jgi:catalase
LSRLGGPNFHQLPVNAPKCPFHNLQRDGIHQMSLQKGRVAYEPNSLDPDAPRESIDRGFHTSARPVEGATVRARSESFNDHYSQARLFYKSITGPEQRHLANALTFELGKVETEAIRLRMLGHLQLIDPGLADTVASNLGAEGKAENITPTKQPVDLKPSPALRLYGKTKPTLQGRKVGLLLGAGFDNKLKRDLVTQIESEGAKVAVVAAKIQGVRDADGKSHAVDMALRASPSVLFDAVAILAGPDGDKQFAADPNAHAFISDARRHCKAVGFSGIPALTKKTGVGDEPGIMELSTKAGPKPFIVAAKAGRFWEREEER